MITGSDGSEASDWEVAERALVELRALRVEGMDADEEALARACRHIHSPDPDVRRQTASTLGIYFSYLPLLQPMLQVAAAETSAYVLRSMLMAMAAIGKSNPEAACRILSFLRDVAGSSQMESVRRQATLEAAYLDGSVSAADYATSGLKVGWDDE